MKNYWLIVLIIAALLLSGCGQADHVSMLEAVHRTLDAMEMAITTKNADLILSILSDVDHHNVANEYSASGDGFARMIIEEMSDGIRYEITDRSVVYDDNSAIVTATTRNFYRVEDLPNMVSEYDAVFTLRRVGDNAVITELRLDRPKIYNELYELLDTFESVMMCFDRELFLSIVVPYYRPLVDEFEDFWLTGQSTRDILSFDVDYLSIA